MPLMVHSTWRAPPSMAASELATARPRSLWQCALKIACSAPITFERRYSKSARISLGVV
jgi:hypothetical protein